MLSDHGEPPPPPPPTPPPTPPTPTPHPTPHPPHPPHPHPPPHPPPPPPTPHTHTHHPPTHHTPHPTPPPPPSKNACVEDQNPFENTVRTPASRLETCFKANFYRSILHEYASNDSAHWSTFTSRHVLLKQVVHLPKVHSPQIYIRSLRKFLCLYLGACAFKKIEGPPWRSHE